MSEFIKSQSEERANLIEAVREVIDFAESEKRGLSAEEIQKIDRLEADIRSKDEQIGVARRAEERKLEASVAAKGFVPAVEARDDNAMLRAIAMGDVRGHEFMREERALTATSGTGVVPATFYDRVFDILQGSNPMFTTSTLITTAGGNSLQVPQITAHSDFTIKAQGSAIAESNPTFSNITLGAYKYSALISLSNELIADSGVNILDLIANISATEIAYDAGAGLTLGTGGGTAPTGIVTAASSAVAGGTGVGGAPTYENLVDLAYSVAGNNRASYGYMMNAQALAAVRKIKDGAGNYIFTPSISVDGRDFLLGNAIYENPAMEFGTSKKSVLYGKLDDYLVRQVGGIQVATSTDYAFNTDVTTFRVTWRGDGNLAATGSVKYFVGAAS